MIIATSDEGARNADGSSDRPRWRSPRVLSLIATSLTIVAIAERDIHRRPSDEIRANKLLWRLASLNAIGAIAYLTVGRQPSKS